MKRARHAHRQGNLIPGKRPSRHLQRTESKTARRQDFDAHQTAQQRSRRSDSSRSERRLVAYSLHIRDQLFQDITHQLRLRLRCLLVVKSHRPSNQE